MTLRGQLQHHAPLADYTSWRVGGEAKTIYHPADKNDLITFLQTLPSDEPLLWLGLGSNTLIRDRGFNGTVIITQSCLSGLIPLNDHTLYAEAGVSCAKIARLSARLNLTGLEFMAGIPGTVGGALKMNAGCHGGETWQTVSALQTINRKGETFKRTPKDYKVHYRHVKGHEQEWFLSAEFKLKSCEPQVALSKIKQLVTHRQQTQPINVPSCGSVFRNPPGQFAARLIEQCQLKGFTLKGAKISEKHANFIINEGHATAADIEALISHIQQTVKRECQIELIPEVHIYGDL